MVAGMMTKFYFRLLSVLLMLHTVVAHATGDPTRPPFEIGDGAAISSLPATTAHTKGLLSVILSAERCSAIIDGKSFKLGEKYGDAVLVEIKADGVVLQGKQGRRSMELFPGVGLKIVSEQTPSLKKVKCKLENQKIENIKNSVVTHNYISVYVSSNTSAVWRLEISIRFSFSTPSTKISFP